MSDTIDELAYTYENEIIQDARDNPHIGIGMSVEVFSVDLGISCGEGPDCSQEHKFVIFNHKIYLINN